MKNIRNKIFQVILLNLKIHWNQAQKPPQTPRDYKLVELYGSKPQNPQKTFTTNLRRIFIQIILPSPKFLLETSFKASRNFKDFDPMKLYQIQALKPRRTFITNLQNKKNI